VTGSFSIEPLSPHHERKPFSCGVDALDRYLQTQATQDIRRHVANCFVAVPLGTSIIAGYYTLAAASIPLNELSEAQRRRLPKYPVLPAALVGRLAVDRQYAGRSLGSALLFDAIQRSARADPAVYALIVDAKDETAAAFYRHFGFSEFVSRPRTFFLALASAAKLIR
jgi:GNAT superfamily N-acetyltransferase